MTFEKPKWNLPGAFDGFKLVMDPDEDLTYKNIKQK